MEPQYWVVWNENGRQPVVKQQSFERAKSEAKRLARNNPGQRFAVLAAAMAFVKDDVREVRFVHPDHDFDPIPF